MSRTTNIILIVVIALAVGALAFFVGTLVAPETTADNATARKTEDGAKHNHDVETIWTCSMHPQIIRDKPGNCPICGMSLVEKVIGRREMESLPELSLTPRQIALAEIATAPVERKFVRVEVRMPGRVEYDETRLAYITAWVPGRLDRLYVDYTGILVEKGWHMTRIYSEDLYSAQVELIEALGEFNRVKDGGDESAKKFAADLLESAREKLRLLGLSDKQVAEIETRSTPEKHITINAPVGGVVIRKYVSEGDRVAKGARIYAIADLSRVWAMLDAYESDLTWIRYGQEVKFETEAWPGEVITGLIAFIDPVVDPVTRTVKVRVNVPNSDGKLKPGMFLRGIVRSKIAVDGKVMDESLTGKWISPMHPEIIRDKPGDCPICGMPLRRAEDLGYAPVEPDRAHAPLVIPDTAPLITGERAVVYVRDPAREGVFRARTITLGPRADGYYIVKDGLQEGELVVKNGNFKIDADLQIGGRRSMMSPEGGAPSGGGHHGH
ncbi:MAG: efflux RND transporter periplasmic adaptor subunit [Planctomycetota bacterium]